MANYLNLDGLLYFYNQKIKPLINKKIDKDQGIVNSGKVLKVGADGNVVPAELDIKTSYTELTAKPKINNVELSGDKTLTELGITPKNIGALPTSTVIPSKVSDLTNDQEYQTASQVNATINSKGYQTSSDVQTKINSAVKDITSFEFKKLNSLPQSGVKGVIYLIANNSSEDKNISDEYIWDGTDFELLGTTKVDLNGYYNTTNLTPLSNSDIDTIVL